MIDGFSFNKLEDIKKKLKLLDQAEMSESY